MVLIDSSVWIEHLRGRTEAVKELLNANEVFVHPFVIGEIACGIIKGRSEVLSMLNNLPTLSVVDDSLVLYFIEQNHLAGIGIGYIDAHLLASVALEHHTWVLTFDKRFRTAAEAMKLAYYHEFH